MPFLLHSIYKNSSIKVILIMVDVFVVAPSCCLDPCRLRSKILVTLVSELCVNVINNIRGFESCDMFRNGVVNLLKVILMMYAFIMSVALLLLRLFTSYD